MIEINEKQADDTELTKKNRRKAKIAADHLLSLINDALQLSKLEDPNIELSYEPFNILAMTNDVVTIIEMKANFRLLQAVHLSVRFYNDVSWKIALISRRVSGLEILQIQQLIDFFYILTVISGL